MKKLIIIFIFCINLYSMERLKLGTSDISKNLLSFKQISKLLKDSFKSIGYDIEFIFLPVERSIKQADQGLLDGDFPRPKDTLKDYQNIFVVEEPVSNMGVYVYSINHNLDNITLNDLRNKKIGILMNFKSIENHLQNKFKNEITLERLLNIDALGEMLEINRVDYLLLPSVIGVELMAQNKFGNIKISKNPVYTFDTYLILNKKYIGIKGKLEKAIRKNKELNK